MKRPNNHLTLTTRAGPVLLILAIAWQSSTAAPAPFERVNPRNRPLCYEDLVGTWTMTWSGQAATMTLSAHGDYVCKMSGLTYVGAWSLDREGRLCITESATPQNSNSWRSYAVRLDPRTLSGSVEVGSPGTKVSLARNYAPIK